MTMAESDNMRLPLPYFPIVVETLKRVLVGQSLNLKHNEKNVNAPHLGILIIPQPFSKK